MLGHIFIDNHKKWTCLMALLYNRQYKVFIDTYTPNDKEPFNEFRYTISQRNLYSTSKKVILCSNMLKLLVNREVIIGFNYNEYPGPKSIYVSGCFMCDNGCKGHHDIGNTDSRCSLFYDLIYLQKKYLM